MKKLVALCMVLVLGLSMTACGGKDENKEKKDKAETQETDKTQESQKDGQADVAEQYCTLAPEGSSVSIQVKVPAGFAEAEYSSETTRIFERSMGQDGGSIQYVMEILDQDEASVEETMRQEVQYILSANADGEEQIMDVQRMEYGGRDWSYFSYGMEDLTGYRVWVELSDGGYFTCTAECVGSSGNELDVDALIQDLSGAISVYEV